MARRAKIRLAQEMLDVSPVKATWISGVWSAFGICTARGYKQEPSCLTMSAHKDMPDRLKAFTGLGRVLGGGRWRWVCDHPDEVRAFYVLLKDAPIPCSPGRLDEIVAAWARFREYTIFEGSGDDPGALDPDDVQREDAEVEALRDKLDGVAETERQAEIERHRVKMGLPPESGTVNAWLDKQDGSA